MTQDRLCDLLNIFIEQEIAYNINVEEVNDTFKTLTPASRRMKL